MEQRAQGQPEPPPPTAGRDLFTLPNLLTLSRVPLGALAWILPLEPALVLGLLALAGITDVLDGTLERRRREKGGGGSSAGVWLDPLCDKIFIVSLLAAITVRRDLPLWMLPLIGLREILQGLVLAATRLLPPLQRRLRPRFRANILGKATTILQFATIAAILLDKPGARPLAVATAVLGLVAVGVYVRRAWRPE